MGKEIKSCERSNKKRNASGESTREEVKEDTDELCTEYAAKRLSDAREARSLIFNQKLPFVCKEENGIEFIQFNYCTKTN